MTGTVVGGVFGAIGSDRWTGKNKPTGEAIAAAAATGIVAGGLLYGPAAAGIGKIAGGQANLLKSMAGYGAGIGAMAAAEAGVESLNS